MDDHQLLRDLSVLADEYPIRVNPDRTVDLVRLEYPTDWNPKRGTLRLVIHDDYPMSPPEVHIPTEMRWRGRRNIIRKKRSQFDGWNRWCVRFAGWEPRRHTLVTVARAMMVSLSDPSMKRLLEE